MIPAERPGARVSPELLDAYIAKLRRQVSPVTLAYRIIGLGAAIRVMEPDMSFPYVAAARRALTARARPVRDTRARLVPSATLFRLALRLLEDAELAPSPYLGASQYRNALIIAISIVCLPWRCNLCGIVIGESIELMGDRFVLKLDAHKAEKTDQPLEISLPIVLTSFIKRYLDHHRRVLLGKRDSNYLFVANSAAEMSERSIYECVHRVMKRELGFSLDVHANHEQIVRVNRQYERFVTTLRRSRRRNKIKGPARGRDFGHHSQINWSSGDGGHSGEDSNSVGRAAKSGKG